ncbi:hypothetical protein M408DRAFT_263942 [Serendipita vermifera MAFF 305830]|uniref:Fungal lipase-type domain-containing protein n=1 Tax=Serendipita vermifera MAFF 305830 TaxID=933852 RepID=A0A0C2WAB7_SERVB|nr:hypothetical protein M408DRAFT_263942 [Serendipita vermifera MAFF 305830]
MPETTTNTNAHDPSVGPSTANYLNGNTTAVAPEQPKLNTQSIEKATENVHLAIRKLLTDEFPDLAKRKEYRRTSEGQQYLRLTWTSMKNYSKTIWKSWWGVTYSFAKIFVGGVSPIDFGIALLYAIAVTVILTAGVIICCFAKLPFVAKAYDAYANGHGGVSFINIVNSSMFENFSEEELEAAKKAMSSTEPAQENVMNIDMAKMMLLFATLTYERSGEARREGIRRCSTMDWTHYDAMATSRSKPLTPNHLHDLFLTHRRDSTSSFSTTDRSSSVSNSPVSERPSVLDTRRPSQQYGTFPPEFTAWQQEYISQSPYSSPISPTNPRQTLLPVKAGGTGGRSATIPTGPKDASAAEDSGVIYTAMKKWGFEYEPVSELDSASSAYSAMYWDKMSNWVVIAFKGTSPPEFDEWLVDFDYTRVPIGDYIPGYGCVHHGFKNRLFPDEPTLNRTPYETIVLALKTVSSDLLSRTPTGVINVYFTGHSLGSGIATLAYARAMQNLDGLDPRVKICDAYMFSSPVASDMDTAKLFNQQIVSGPYGPRTTWRILNHHDAVATFFPAMGDDPRYAYPDSLFAFAHLGTEVKMRRKPTQSIAENNYASQSSTAKAVSDLPEEKVGVVPKGMDVPLWMRGVQYIPLAGWMFSHFPGLYFVELQAMGSGDMEWRRKQAMD